MRISFVISFEGIDIWPHGGARESQGDTKEGRIHPLWTTNAMAIHPLVGELFQFGSK